MEIMATGLAFQVIHIFERHGTEGSYTGLHEWS